MKTRYAALKKYYKSGLSTDRMIYNQFRNKVTQQLRHAKATFYLNLINQARGNSKQLWQIIDKLTGKKQSTGRMLELKIDGKSYKDGPTIANHFSNYFIDAVNEMTQLSSGSPHAAQPQPLASVHEALSFKYFDISKTAKLIVIIQFKS